MGQSPITIDLNGHSHTVSVEPDTPLLYVLRDSLELHGAKFGADDSAAAAVLPIEDRYDQRPKERRAASAGDARARRHAEHVCQ